MMRTKQRFDAAPFACCLLEDENPAPMEPELMVDGFKVLKSITQHLEYGVFPTIFRCADDGATLQGRRLLLIVEPINLVHTPYDLVRQGFDAVVKRHLVPALPAANFRIGRQPGIRLHHPQR